MDFRYYHTGSRIAKRFEDLLISPFILLLARPFQGLMIRSKSMSKDVIELNNHNYSIYRLANGQTSFWSNLSLLPLVIRGKLSLVGSPIDLTDKGWDIKHGIFSLESGTGGAPLSEEERYSLLNYYLHNHSVLLDLEIIIKALLRKIV